MELVAGSLVIRDSSKTWNGITISPKEGETVRECLERCTIFYPPGKYPVINMIITCPACGKSVEYKTLDDVPDHDVPCCKPDYYFIKIGKLNGTTETDRQRESYRV